MLPEKNMSKEIKGDVGIAEDLIFTLKNLVAIEDHALNSYVMNRDSKWLEVRKITRTMRRRWMEHIVKKEASQIWCITKHVNAAMMGLSEIADRFVEEDQEELAKEAHEDYHILYGLLLELNGV